MTAIFPMGCQAGGEAEIVAFGADLEGATDLYFSRAGISAEPVKAGENKFNVKVDAGVPEGVYEVRYIGAFGVSNPRPFVVSTATELSSPANNTSMAAAFTVHAQSAVNGVAIARQSAWFKLDGKKDRRLLFRLSAETIDSRLDPVVYLRDAEGARLERAGASGLIDHTPAKDGDLFIQIHDAAFAGGQEHFFRLEITEGPHVDFVYPPVLTDLKESKVTLFGRNLPDSEPSETKGADGRKLEKLVVRAGDLTRAELPGGVALPPASIVLDGGVYRLGSGKFVSNPFFIAHASGQPLTLENENAKNQVESQTVASPGILAGRFFPARDVDVYKFPIKKDGVYWLDVHSQRLGQNTNPYITAQVVNVAADGKESPEKANEFYESKDNPGGREFNMTNRDVTWRFQAKSDGYLRVEMRDLFNQASDDSFKTYLVSVRREAPGLKLVVHPKTVPVAKDKRNIELMATHLRKGSSLPIQLVAIRQGNFNGPIKVHAKNLPEGIRLRNSEFKQGQKAITAHLMNEGREKPFAGEIHFGGQAEIGGASVDVPAVTMVTRHRVGDYNNEPVLSRLAKGSVLSVSEIDPEPVRVTPVGQAAYKGVVNGKVKIPLSIERHGEFTANFKLKAYGVSHLDKLGELEVKKDQKEATLEIDLAKLKVPVGRYEFHLESTVKGKYYYPPLNGKKSDKKRDVTYRLISLPIMLEVSPESAPKPEEK
ncbi:MAG: hypothetical protein CMO63_07915 [Verrucomicrobiales bacterium]|nr:hypothetical protein [Verrucomicrobiales bacterium]